MKTVAVLNRKGGVGKTTLATNLARSLQLRGNEVVLVDTDPQESAQDWASTSEDVEVPVTVGVDRPILHTELPRLEGYDLAVIDGVAKMEKMSVSAVKASDLVLIPVRPSALSMWSAGELVELIRSRQEATGLPNAAFVLSQAVVGTNLADEADEALARLDLPVWPGTHQRIAYAKAVGRGVSVLDLRAEKAAQEIEELTDRVLDTLNQPEQSNE